MATNESTNKLRVSLTGVKAAKQTLRPYVEPGRYSATILSVTETTARSNGKRMAEVEVRLSQNAVLTDNMSLVDDFGLARLVNLCEATGISPDEDGLDLDAFAGKTCDADVDTSRVSKGDGSPFSVIKGYHTSKGIGSFRRVRSF